MSWRTTIARTLSYFGRGRSSRERALQDELRTHIDFETDENIERGMTPDEARRNALVKFGNQQLVQEDSGAQWSLPSLESLIKDIHFGWRVLWKAPGFSIIAVLTLALGIGATTAIFSVAYSVLIKPLPYPDPEKLVLVAQDDRSNQASDWRVTAFDYLDIRERARSFEGVAAYTGAGLVISGDGPAEMVLGQRVSNNFFSVIGVHPKLGRDFRPEEEEKGKDRVIVLSDQLWHRRFGGDPNVVGKTLTINHEPYTIIGVMPQGFAFPLPRYQAWTPQSFRGAVDPQWINRSAHFLRTIGRLRPGVSITQAESEMTRIAADLEREYPDTNTNEGAHVESLRNNVLGDVGTPLVLLLAASACLLLIACANIANLLLARGTAREREIAVRQALGASNGRIFRQLLTENLMLAIAGGALGCAMAWGLVQAVRKLGPADLPRLSEIRVDSAALLFALAIAMATGLLIGMSPLVSLRKNTTSETLKESGTAHTGGRGVHRLRAILVCSEVAISALLLIVAGLTVRSLMRLDAINPGFNPDQTVTFSVVMMEQRYPTGDRMRQFVRDLTDKLKAIPGVEAIGMTTSLPLGGNSWSNPVSADATTQSALLGIRAITSEYMTAMQTSFVRGRSFTPQDSENSELVAIISESTASKLFPGTDPIGRHVKLGNRDSTEAWRRIVGIVADVHERSLDAPPESLLYVPYTQLGDPVTAMTSRGVYVVLRTNADATSVVNAARARVAQLDSTMPMNDVLSLRELVSASVAQPRFRTFLFSTFGICALVLAAVGLYGVLSYAVAQRRFEFGIRIALGARQFDLLRLVYGEGGRLVIIGLTIAVASALLVRRTFASVLFGISPSDPLTIVGVLVVIILIAGAAIYLPARRAMHANPMTAIRHE